MKDDNLEILHSSLKTLFDMLDLLPSTDIVDELVYQLTYITTSVQALRNRKSYTEQVIDEAFDGLDYMTMVADARIKEYKKSQQRKVYPCT